MNLSRIFNINQPYKVFCSGQKRFRYKKKWAASHGPLEPEQAALRHFDHYYEPIYGRLWPSIRISLLSQQKYGAVLNNHGDSDNIIRHLESANELIDVIKLAEETDIRNYAKRFNISHLGDHHHQDGDFEGGENERFEFSQYGEECGKPEQLFNQGNVGNITRIQAHSEPDSLTLRDPHDLYSFMPVTRVYSEKEEQQMEEVEQSSFVPRDIQVEIIPETDFSLPKQLRIVTPETGIVGGFPSPKVDSNGLLPYYLMDASSILPVVAMGIETHDKILDLCAAPGGKSLVMLQTLLSENITCNDISYSRLGRLFDILRSYLPSTPPTFSVTHKNGSTFTEPVFNKVLVDVPCNTDRHMLSETDQNLFKQSRFKERMQLPDLEKNLLIAGIQSCMPGGSIVYSTCTLSPAQNDGIIQAAFEDIWKNTDIDIQVVDTSWVAEKFRKTFRFDKQCRYGQLVIPTLTNNFGPMYFCKIKRLK